MRQGRNGMTHRAALLSLVALLLALGVPGCGRSAAPEPRKVYVDGTRGCKEPAAAVALWSAPGAAAVGAEVVAEAPHGRLMEALETVTQYGIAFYLVELEDGQRGWLPINYSETIAPVCD